MKDMNHNVQKFVNDKLAGRTIDVTAADINEGDCNSASKCAIALSLERSLVGSDMVFVGTTDTNIVYERIINDNKQKMVIEVKNDREVSAWISDFDSGWASPIQLMLEPTSDIFHHLKLVVKC